LQKKDYASAAQKKSLQNRLVSLVPSQAATYQFDATQNFASAQQN
jgi:hypothetical protein